MIRRPLMYIAVSMAGLIIIVYYAGPVRAMAIVGLGFALLRGKGVGSAVRRLLLAGFAAGIISMALWSLSADPLADMAGSGSGETAAVCGRVQSVSEKVSGEEIRKKMVMRPMELNENPSGPAYHSISSARYVEITCSEKLLNFDPLPGDYIEVRGKVELPACGKNPGAFDYRLYLKSQNITSVIYAHNIYKVRSGGTSAADKVRRYSYILREKYIDCIESSADMETASFIRAIMFGDKGQMDEEVLQQFQRNGTAHILAVSGLHIGIIYGFLIKLWDICGSVAGWITGLAGIEYRRKARGFWFLVLTGTFFAGYVIITDFAPSVVRAVCMVMIHSIAQMTGKRYDLNSAAFLVFLLVLFIRPYMLFNAGFQMSFLAVLTMTAVLPYIRSVYSGIFLSGLAVQIGLGPYLVYNFNYISLLAILVNIPIIALAGLIVPAGVSYMFLVALYYVSGKLAFIAFAMGALGKVTGGLCQILISLNGISEWQGVTTFMVGSPRLWIVVTYYICLLILLSEEGRLRLLKVFRREGSLVEAVKYAALTVCTGAVLAAGFCGMLQGGFYKSDVTFVDVGQGDCMHVKALSDGVAGTGLLAVQRNYLIDGGGSDSYNVGVKTLKPYLLKAGVTHIDGAFVTHLHTDHYKGICQLAQEGMVDRIYVYEGNKGREDEIVKDTGMKRQNICYLSKGCSVMMGEEYAPLHERLLNRLQGKKQLVINHVIWPEKKTDAEYEKILADEEDENSMSLVFRLSFGECVSMLATGDIDTDGENELIEHYEKNSSILKVAHHGSRYSSGQAFLDVIKPEIAVIQVGRNNYGHPTDEAMRRITDAGAVIYRNDKNGAIGIEIRRGSIRKVRSIVDGESEIP